MGESVRFLRSTALSERLTWIAFAAVVLTTPACESDNTSTFPPPIASASADGRRPSGLGTSDPTAKTAEDLQIRTDGVVRHYWVLVTAVDPGRRTVTVNPVRYFTGAAAQRACRQDRVPGHRGGLCDEFYFRDGNRGRWTLPVPPEAPVTLLADGCMDSRPATLERVRTELAELALFRLDVVDGSVSRLTGACPD